MPMLPIPDPEDPRRYITNESQVIAGVHSPARCEGQPCSIHHPSNHHMVNWPQRFSDEARRMERFCGHAVWHPDPDNINPDIDHVCDGCCTPP